MLVNSVPLRCCFYLTSFLYWFHFLRLIKFWYLGHYLCSRKKLCNWLYFYFDSPFVGLIIFFYKGTLGYCKKKLALPPVPSLAQYIPRKLIFAVFWKPWNEIQKFLLRSLLKKLCIAKKTPCIPPLFQ